MFVFVSRHDGNVGTYVEQRAVEAMCALLCCGPIFEPIKSIGEDGYLYGWLEALLDSNNPVVKFCIMKMIGKLRFK